MNFIFEHIPGLQGKGKIINLWHWWYNVSHKALLCIEAKQEFSSNLKGPWNHKGKLLQYSDKLLYCHYWLLIIVKLTIISCCKVSLLWAAARKCLQSDKYSYDESHIMSLKQLNSLRKRKTKGCCTPMLVPLKNAYVAKPKSYMYTQLTITC